MQVHQLKVHPQFWPSLKSGQKNFEVRRNDRQYKVGDRLVLREYDPAGIGYTNSMAVERSVTYILTQDDMPAALNPGYVVLGLR